MSDPDIRTPEGGRWDCGGCTACCRHFALGPVRDEIIEGLEALGIRQAWEPARDGFATRQQGPDGEEAWFLERREDGACIFLEEDGRCAIHARYGAEAKPAFCREYPFTVVEEDTHTAVFVRADCGGWAESFDTGTPIADQAAEILALPRLHRPGRFTMDPVVVLPGVGIDRAAWPTVEATLVPLLDADHEPERIVADCASALHRLVKRPAPQPEPGVLEAGVALSAQVLARSLRPAVENPPGDDPATRGMVAFLAEVLDLLDRALEEVPGPRRPLAPSSRAYLALVLRSQLLGRTFQPLGGVPSWLGVTLLGVHLAAAAAPGDDPLEARIFGRELATWVRFTRHDAARRLLVRLKPVLDDLFVHAGG